MKRVIIFFLTVLLSKYAIADNDLNKKELEWLKSNSEVSELGCDKFENSTGDRLKLKYRINVKPSVFKNNIYDEGILVCKINYNFDDAFNSYILELNEVTTIDGVKVSINHSGGYGRIGNDPLLKKDWSVSCETDAMTDKSSCHMYYKNFYIYRDKAGYQIRVASSGNLPALIRIDKNDPLPYDKNKAYSRDTSNKMVSVLMNASTVTIRSFQAAYNNVVDTNIDMTNFKIAKAMLDKLYTNYKS